MTSWYLEGRGYGRREGRGCESSPKPWHLGHLDIVRPLQFKSILGNKARKHDL